MVVVSPPFALLVTKTATQAVYTDRLPRFDGVPARILAGAEVPAGEFQARGGLHILHLVQCVQPVRRLRCFDGFMADIWRLDQAKRLFGFIGVGGTLGALAGSKIASLLAKPIGSVNLLFLSIVLLRSRSFNCAPSRRHPPSMRCTPGQNATPPAAISTSDMWRGLKLIVSQSYLRWIASYTFMYGLIGTFLYYQQGKLVDLTIHDRDVRTEYFANIEFWVQLGTVLIQFLLTARLIRWFGITFALISQPAIAVLGWIALSLAMIYGPWLGTRGFTVGQLAPELAVLAGVQILLRISNFATAQPAREALHRRRARGEAINRRASSTRSSIASAIASGPGRSWAFKPSVRASQRSQC